MTLDPQIKQFLEKAGAGFGAYATMTPVEARRKSLEAFLAKPQPPHISIASMQEKVIPGPAGHLKIRVFVPEGRGPFPGLMYFHGGGFVLRDNMDTYAQSCRMICHDVPCVVVAVDYRLAPEHPFPAAPEDCYAATCWVVEHARELQIDPNRIGVWGESCGGNLATVIPMMARDRSGPKLACQILVTPMLDCTMQTPSYRENASGYFLTKEAMQWFWRQYFSSDADQSNAYATPAQAKEVTNLPPTLVVTVEYDPLRDEGDRYAQRLQKAGVPTIHRSYPGLIHGFFDLYSSVAAASQACQDVIAITKDYLKN